MRKMRKQPVCAYNPWNHDIEVGWRLYQWLDINNGVAMIYDVRESSGRNKSACGILTAHLVKKDGRERVALQRRDEAGQLTWYWQD
jgi:hypothetical protein